MLKILHVIESLAQGGAEQNLLSILRRLGSEHYEHHLAWLYEPDNNPMLEAFRGCTASLIRLQARPRYGIGIAALTLARWIRHNRPDVVHAQLLRSQFAARAGAILSGGTPVVCTWQGSFYEDDALGEFSGSKARRAVVRWIDRTSGRWDRRFIAVSQHVAGHFSRELHIPSRRITVIHNAVEPARYAPVGADQLERTRRELALPPDAKIILSVGRLIRLKAHEEAIAAMTKVLERFPEAVFLIAGGGPLESQLRSQVEWLGLSGRVRLLGTRKDVPALYQLADLFLFVSQSEGLSVALVEALSNGLPAVVSDIPQNREVADGLASVRFVAKEPQGVAIAIEDALARLGELKGEAQRQQSAIQRRFAPEVLAEQIGGVFRQAAHRTAPVLIGAF